MSADRMIVETFEAVANRMTASGLPGEDLRERQHLDPWSKDELSTV